MDTKKINEKIEGTMDELKVEYAPAATLFVKMALVGIAGYFLGKRVGKCEGVLMCMSSVTEALAETVEKGA